jgi:hypothetical protein
MRRSWQQTAGADENEQNAAEPAATDKKEQEKKKRKLMQGLKKWTGLADAGERKFKGCPTMVTKRLNNGWWASRETWGWQTCSLGAGLQRGTCGSTGCKEE